jgi:ribonuclease H2 subunit A
MDDLEESQPEIDIGLETAIPGTFVPPSINYDILLSGESYEHYSTVPPGLLESENASLSGVGPPCALGIDEAGRGPVLGPMVYGAFYLPIPLSAPLLSKTHHFDDSKVLTPLFRSQLMEKLCTPTASNDPDPTSLYQNCGWAVSLLSARTISAGMLQPTTAYNLNAQAMDATISLITNIYKLGVNLREIYIDTIGQPAPYQKKLERIFPTAKIVVAKKADSLYPCVSAASVCAKVTRDVALEVIYKQNYKDKMEEDTEMSNSGVEKEEDERQNAPGWGSGYPSDVRCTAWMKRNMDPVFGWGSECRFSWGTAKDMLDLKGGAAPVVWPAEDDDESSRLTDFFSSETDDNRTRDLMSNWYGQRIEADSF